MANTVRIPCPDCVAQAAEDTPACPHCGHMLTSAPHAPPGEDKILITVPDNLFRGIEGAEGVLAIAKRRSHSKPMFSIQRQPLFVNRSDVVGA